MKVSAIIIDDIELARKSLRADIEEFCPDVLVLAEAGDVVSGVESIKTHQPDIVFLDIHLGRMNGFDLLNIVDLSGSSVIFVTGSKDHAVDAFKVEASDYLLKPVDPAHLIRAVRKIVTNRSISGHKIGFHTADVSKWVEPKEIIRLQAEGNYTLVYFSGGSKLLVTKTLKEYDIRLQKDGFIRTHQSHLVNPIYVAAYVKSEGGYLSLSNGDQIPVSLRKKQAVLDLLENG